MPTKNAIFMLESHLKYRKNNSSTDCTIVLYLCTFLDTAFNPQESLRHLLKSLLEWWHQLLNSDVSSPTNLSIDLLRKKTVCPSIFLYSLVCTLYNVREMVIPSNSISLSLVIPISLMYKIIVQSVLELFLR